MPSCFADFPVRLGSEVEGGYIAPGFDGDVVFLGFAGWDFVARQIGDAGKREPQLLVERGCGLVEVVELVFEGARLVHQLGSVFAFALKRTDLLGEIVTTGFQLFGGRDGFAAFLIELAKIAEECGGIGTASTEFSFHNFQVAPDESQIEHDSYQFS